jgi:hypothetical protein
MSLIQDVTARNELRRAWQESQPATANAHEEGGFILRGTDGSLRVERWPVGEQDGIDVPAHPGGRYGGDVIVATFHTHPNTGPDYQQEPSLTDIRAVHGDPDLHHPEYQGEYVISLMILYLIRPDGSVEEVGDTATLLSLGGS